MTASLYSSAERTEAYTPAVMPKINTRPPHFSRRQEESDHTLSTQENVPTASQPLHGVSRAARDRADWDVKFALWLIALVVVVNATLTLLLSGETTRENQDIFVRETAAVSSQVPTTGTSHLTPTQKMSIQGASDTELPPTEVFISPEDKRVLLRQLNQIPSNWREGVKKRKQDEQTGTYRSIDKANTLSIIQRSPK